MTRHFRLTTLVALFVIIPAVAAGAAPFAYIPNSGSGDITVLDLAAAPGAPASVALPGATLPWGVALNRAGTRLYVTNMGNGSVYVLNTAVNPPSLLATITVRTMPVAVAVNAAGSRVYVAHQRVSRTSGAVTVIDAATNTVLASVDVGATNAGIAVHPDGSRVYLASAASVLVLDAGRLESGVADIQAAVAAGNRPFALALNASGSRLYVTAQSSGTVAAIDTATNTVVAEGFVGSAPIGLALSPDERRLYAANSGSGTLSVLDAITLQPAAVDVVLGGAPSGVDVSADGRIFVTNSATDATTIWVIDPATFAVSTRAVGVRPVAFGTFVQRPAFVETALQLSIAPSSVIVGSSGPVTLTATLTRQDTGAPVAGAAVTFAVNGTAVGSATTGGSGTATLAYNPAALAVGSHSVRAAFAESTLGGALHRASEAAGSFAVVYQFAWRTSGGTVTAGSTVPIRFSLLDAAGSPIADGSFVIDSAACPAGASAGSRAGRTTASAAGNSGLRYDAASGQYLFNWKTERTWAGTCRELIVGTADGQEHRLTFWFR